MALNSDPRIGLRELWDLGVRPIEACAQHATDSGYAIGPNGLLTAVLNSLISTLQFSLEQAGNSNKLPGNALENSKKIMAENSANELNARNWLIRALNNGRQIAIGRRVYLEGRTELRYVWDSRLSAKRLNWFEDSYCGPTHLFSAIRVISRSNCPDDLLKQFDRARSQRIGRPKLKSIEIAIERVAGRDSDFDKGSYFKRAAYLVGCEIEKMRFEGATTETPSEKTIQNAIRKRRRYLS